jgi:NAD(P)-dependent dehydrogenase (short-subunit alcohol dehydrogenase family)
LKCPKGGSQNATINPMRGLKDKTVLISGGTSGIGYATAQRFLEEGSKVFVCGHSKTQLQTTLESLRPLGHIAGCVCDVTQEKQVKAMLKKALSFLGNIDILISNAGTAWQEEFLKLRLENWDKMQNVNLRGMFLVSQYVAKHMTSKKRKGVILLMASTNGLAGEKLYAHYNASKGGVISLMQTMALELGPSGIRVNALCPGFILTPLNETLNDERFIQDYANNKIPLGKVGKAEDVAAAYAFLASEDASFIHGTTLVIDGGQLSE